jgi:hypothetical protein
MIVWMAGVPHTDPHSAWAAEVATLRRPRQGTEKGYFENTKKCQNPEDLRTLTLCQICDIPLLSSPEWHVKIWPGAMKAYVCDIVVGAEYTKHFLFFCREKSLETTYSY